jgi:hypothetical protein
MNFSDTQALGGIQGALTNMNRKVKPLQMNGNQQPNSLQAYVDQSLHQFTKGSNQKDQNKVRVIH